MYKLEVRCYTPIAEDVRDTSEQIFKLKDEVLVLNEETKKLFGDLQGRVPHQERLFKIINPVYLTLALLHIGILILGLWILYLGVRREPSNVSQVASITDVQLIDIVNRNRLIL